MEIEPVAPVQSFADAMEISAPAPRPSSAGDEAFLVNYDVYLQERIAIEAHSELEQQYYAAMTPLLQEQEHQPVPLGFGHVAPVANPQFAATATPFMPLPLQQSPSRVNGFAYQPRHSASKRTAQGEVVPAKRQRGAEAFHGGGAFMDAE